ncbi:hypothetical protein [Xanthomonas arboricola]|uniref:hypothetical protein n=1 Tax=Xanthomonas arboricola TaxID=56448 RepID=UPI0011B00BBE|nr:hypothetical protein [Xanthomonas arboricola]
MSKTDPKFFIRPSLTEKQIEADVATYLGWISPSGRRPFVLRDLCETTTGADKSINVGALIHMQFKRSLGLKSESIVPISRAKNRSHLESIRQYRASEELEENPTLFFRLHRLTGKEYQHNTLMKYERPPWSRAIYVAPLFLDLPSYESALFAEPRYLHDPFRYQMTTRIWHEKWISIFGQTPFLRGHVSIPPHEHVTTHHHYYAYSTTGTEITWHSDPKKLPNHDYRFSSFLGNFIRESIRNSEATRSLSELADFTAESMSEAKYQRKSDPLLQLEAHARGLLERDSIRTFAVLYNSEFLEDLRGEI